MTRREVPWEQRMALRVEEVAQLLGISRTKAYELVREGRIPSVKLDEATIRVPRRALEELIDQGVRVR